MQTLDETAENMELSAEILVVKLPSVAKLPGDSGMTREQEEAMQIAPAWAKVILSFIRDDISALGHFSREVSDSINFNDTRIKSLESENVKLQTSVTKHQSEIESLNTRLAKLEVSQKTVEERVIRHEVHARKPNLIISGIREDGNDTWDACRTKVNDVLATMGLGYNPREIKMDKVHRLGPPPNVPKGRFQQMELDKLRPRPIIMTFSWQVDRDRVWRARGNL
jgi:hypothetical protein